MTPHTLFDSNPVRSKFSAAFDPGSVDRVPPHSTEAEQGVLGCILWSPKSCLSECEASFKGDVFYDLRHQIIYNACVSMAAAMEAIDIITLQQRLKDEQKLDQVGGLAYLSSLQDTVPSAANLSYYREIVEEKAVLRHAIQTCSNIVARAYDNQGEVDELLDEAERDILSIRMKRTPARNNNIRAIMKNLTQKYQEAHERGTAPGLMSGFHDLDKIAGGMMEQEMIVIGGIPSSGKTTLALNIALNVAEAGTSVSICSLETSAEKLVHRYNCMAGRVEGGKFLRGEPQERDFTKMQSGMTRMMKLADKLIIHDDPMTGGQLSAVCRQDYASGCRLFIVDYLQLIQIPCDNEFERVTKASNCIKSIAKELNCPVIVVSALSRPDKKAKPRKPTLNDLKQSGQIEYDADKAYLLHTDVNQPVRTINCNIAKNKDGETGACDLTMFASQFRFESQSPVHENDTTKPYTD